MSGDELALLGHLIGDGCTFRGTRSSTRPTISSSRSMVADLATRVFGDRVKPALSGSELVAGLPAGAPSASAGARAIRSRSGSTGSGLSGCGATRSGPAAVFEQSSGDISRFLRHLWATDGCVFLSKANGTQRIYYASSSERLALDVQSLLLRFGINAKRQVAPPRIAPRAMACRRKRSRRTCTRFLAARRRRRRVEARSRRIDRLSSLLRA